MCSVHAVASTRNNHPHPSLSPVRLRSPQAGVPGEGTRPQFAAAVLISLSSGCTSNDTLPDSNPGDVAVTVTLPGLSVERTDTRILPASALSIGFPVVFGITMFAPPR